MAWHWSTPPVRLHATHTGISLIWLRPIGPGGDRVWTPTRMLKEGSVDKAKCDALETAAAECNRAATMLPR
jgi:hypothetical protein